MPIQYFISGAGFPDLMLFSADVLRSGTAGVKVLADMVDVHHPLRVTPRKPPPGLLPDPSGPIGDHAQLRILIHSRMSKHRLPASTHPLAVGDLAPGQPRRRLR